MNRLRNTVVLVTLTCLFLPFVLLVDVYPLYRFGMYSKSLKKMDVIEEYFVRLNYGDSTRDYATGLSQDLIRRYLYRHETDLLLQKIYEENKADTGITSVDLYVVKIMHDSQMEEPALIKRWNVRR